MTGGYDEREVAADVEAVIASHRALVDHLRELAPVDPSTPSELPGWTVGHVLTHLARNADSHHRLLAGYDQYPHGWDGRNADIEAGAGRTWGESVADVERTCAALSAASSFSSTLPPLLSLRSTDMPFSGL